MLSHISTLHDVDCTQLQPYTGYIYTLDMFRQQLLILFEQCLPECIFEPIDNSGKICLWYFMLYIVSSRICLMWKECL